MSKSTIRPGAPSVSTELSRSAALYTDTEIAELRNLTSTEIQRAQEEQRALENLGPALGQYQSRVDVRSPDALRAARRELADAARRFLAQAEALEDQHLCAVPQLKTALDGLALMAVVSSNNYSMVDSRHPVKNGRLEVLRMGLLHLEKAATGLAKSPFAKVFDLDRIRASIATVNEEHRALLDRVDDVRADRIAVSEVFPSSELFAVEPAFVGKKLGEILGEAIRTLRHDPNQRLLTALRPHESSPEGAIATLERLLAGMKLGHVIRNEVRWRNGESFRDPRAISVAPFHRFEIDYGGPLPTLLGVLSSIDTNDDPGPDRRGLPSC